MILGIIEYSFTEAVVISANAVFSRASPATFLFGLLAIAFLSISLGRTRVRSGVVRRVCAAGWVVFALFWLTMLPEFAFVEKSPLKTILTLGGIPVALYIASVTYHETDVSSSVFQVSGAVSIMGWIYLPFSSIAFLRQWLIEEVTLQTLWGVQLLGYSPQLTHGPDYGYLSALRFTHIDGVQPLTYIELACTGLGSIAILLGVLSLSREPLEEKVVWAVGLVGLVTVLNWIRNVFIATAFGDQLLQVGIPWVVALFSLENPALVSFYLADKVISQVLSVIVLVGIGLALFKYHPSIQQTFEELVEDLGQSSLCELPRVR